MGHCKMISKYTKVIYSLCEKSKIRHEVIRNRGMATAVKSKQRDSKWRVGNILGQITLREKCSNIYIHKVQR